MINDIGEVVWHAYDGNDYEIFFYDGTSLTRITDNEFQDIGPRVNDAGEVVWLAHDHPGYQYNAGGSSSGGGGGGG
jgi:hypothetical protein